MHFNTTVKLFYAVNYSIRVLIFDSHDWQNSRCVLTLFATLQGKW